MKLNHSLKFSTSRGPSLDDLTLGYIYAACDDLDVYSEFSDKNAEVINLSHMSVIMMRDEVANIFEKSKFQLEISKNYNHISLEQLGHDIWLASNGKETLFISKLPISIKENILTSLSEHSNPCQLIKINGNFVFQFKDSGLNDIKDNEYCQMYRHLTIVDSSTEFESVSKPIRKP